MHVVERASDVQDWRVVQHGLQLGGQLQWSRSRVLSGRRGRRYLPGHHFAGRVGVLACHMGRRRGHTHLERFGGDPTTVNNFVKNTPTERFEYTSRRWMFWSLVYPRQQM